MKAETIDKLQVARVLAETPFKINSAIRCSHHNAAVGGSPSSAHLYGFAVDIGFASSSEAFAIVRGLMLAGFRRILHYPNFIHVDTDPEKAQNVLVYMSKETGNR